MLLWVWILEVFEKEKEKATFGAERLFILQKLSCVLYLASGVSLHSLDRVRFIDSPAKDSVAALLITVFNTIYNSLRARSPI